MVRAYFGFSFPRDLVSPSMLKLERLRTKESTKEDRDLVWFAEEGITGVWFAEEGIADVWFAEEGVATVWFAEEGVAVVWFAVEGSTLVWLADGTEAAMGVFTSF